MKTIKVKSFAHLPKNYTGIAEFSDGSKHWHLNGKYHREDGPAIEFSDGEKWWYLNGELHRENGPAIENIDGTKEWYLNGILHRENGPAIEFSDGDKSYYLHGKPLFKENIDFWLNLGYPQKTAIKLSYLLETDKS